MQPLALLTSPAAFAALVAAVLVLPLTNFITWPALARGRPASSLALAAGAGAAAFIIVSRLTARPAG